MDDDYKSFPGYSVVERIPDQMAYHCGYCGGKDTAKARGLWSYTMNAIDYQALIDRGWRRSGKYCYLPFMNKTCCPQYTIRCHALDCKITKSQKKVLHRMRKFLQTEGDEELEKWKKKNAEDKEKEGETSESVKMTDVSEKTPEKASKSALDEKKSKESKKLLVTPGDGPDPGKPPCKKAKVLRKERNIKKGDSKKPPSTPKNRQKTLEELIPHLNPSPDFKRKLEVRMVRAKDKLREFEPSRAESHAVYAKYQRLIHKDKPEEYTDSQWIRFLVDSALFWDDTGPGPGYGNYHQQYVLDGKIIAVGVVDILTNCLSSVYLYYDPDYGFLSLGTYAALSELAYTRHLAAIDRQKILKYYYMGFYVHSCPKMTYKNNYQPSELLCPESFEWVSTHLCLKALDENKYCRLNLLNGGSPTAVDKEAATEEDINDMAIIYRRNLMCYFSYSRWKYINVPFPEQSVIYYHKEKALKEQGEIEEEMVELKDYIKLIGLPCARRMFLFRSYDPEKQDKGY